MRNIITLLLFFFAVATHAQTSDTTGRIDVFSALGLGFVDNGYQPASGNSIQTTTGLELKLSHPSRIGASLTFDSYGFKQSTTSYTVDGTLRLTALALFYRYKFGTHKVQPYLKAGGGTAWLSIPVVSVGQGVTNLKQTIENVGMGLAEVGLQVGILSRYSFLIGAEKKWLAKSNLADGASLGTTTFKIGMVSSF